jgi:predicted ester cyclase
MPATTPDAHLDLAAVMAALTEDIVKGADPPEAVIDRYFTSDVFQISDGTRFGRDELIAHVRPVRKNLVDFRYEIHDSVSDGDRLAARYTLHGRMRNGRSIATEVYAFGERAADGRLRRIDQLTRELPARDPAQTAT